MFLWLLILKYFPCLYLNQIEYREAIPLPGERGWDVTGAEDSGKVFFLFFKYLEGAK